MSQETSSIQITISLDQLKEIIREAVHEALADMVGEEESSHLLFTPEIAERLKKYKNERPESVSVDEVVKKLGLNV